MITDVEWKSIHKATAPVACTFFKCLDPSGCLDPGQPHKKKFFKFHFSTEWNAMLLELEGMCPLLSNVGLFAHAMSICPGQPLL
jgi:hypothetical protein